MTVQFYDCMFGAVFCCLARLSLHWLSVWNPCGANGPAHFTLTLLDAAFLCCSSAVSVLSSAPTSWLKGQVKTLTRPSMRSTWFCLCPYLQLKHFQGAEFFHLLSQIDRSVSDFSASHLLQPWGAINQKLQTVQSSRPRRCWLVWWRLRHTATLSTFQHRPIIFPRGVFAPSLPPPPVM